MDTDAIAGFTLVLCFLVSLVLSLWNMRHRFPFVDRFLPAILQLVILMLSLMPGDHGHPREIFAPMMLILLWSAFALVSSCRLYHIPVRTFQILGFSQFVESLVMALLAILGYTHACYVYYGHFVWNP